jgi:hypothetical protein
MCVAYIYTCIYVSLIKREGGRRVVVTRCGMDLARIDEGGVTGSWETGAGIKNVRHVHMHGVRQMAVGGIRGCMVSFCSHSSQ